MASKKEYLDFILGQLSNLDGISTRPMMGEYIIYVNGIVIGGIYDDRFLVKKCDLNKHYGMYEIIPYPNARPMYFVTEVDDIEILEKIITDTYQGLL